MDLSPFKQDVDELINEFAQVISGFALFRFDFGRLFPSQLLRSDVDFLRCWRFYVQGESTALADMKRVWLSRKFSYIYEARPSSNLTFFMQTLYSQSIGERK